MKRRSVDFFLLKLLILIVALIVVTQVLGMGSLTSYLFLLTFPITGVLWIWTVKETVTGLDLLMVATAAIAVVCVFLDAGIRHASVSFSYLRKCIMFVMTLLFFQTAYRMRVGQNVVGYVSRIADMLALFLIFMFMFQNTQMHLLNGRVTNYLTFRMSNPNLTGLFLICLYIYELCQLFFKERRAKWVHLVLGGFLAYFIVKSQSRNSMLVLVLFTAVCLWLWFKGGRNLYIGAWSAAMIAVLPAVFVAVYMPLVSSPWVQNVFAFLVEEGKGLDSRVEIWSHALRHLRQSMLIGSYSGISNGTGISQMHNSHLDLAASYGMPVLIVVCILLWHYLHQQGRQFEDKQAFVYILGFACAIALGIGEAALFSGGLGVYVFVGMFLMLADVEPIKGSLDAL